MAGLCSRGCGKPIRARGLCSTHYNHEHQPNRHRTVTVPCGQCGKPCLKEPTRARRYAVLVCSLSCRDAARTSLLARAQRKAERAARGTIGQLWVGGDCHSCGMGFVGRGRSARYCSPGCANREKNHKADRRKRMRLKQVHRTPYARVDIYRRDGWRCHLCGGRVRRDVHYLHPEAPTIDHLVPVARGGDDVPSNVMCAHRSCNSKRGTGGTVQLLLIG
jgi:hypothetical protein